MGSGTLILNVDDYEPSLYTKSHVLRRAGYEVREAGSGRLALDVVSHYRPQLVVLDVHLPDMSGLEVCRSIKTQFREIKVLQTSATHVAVADRVRGLENGADAYVVEPLDPDEFLANVNALLRIRKAEDALREKEAELRRLLAEKELLMREIHHRVKNNMQIITSLVQLDPAMAVHGGPTIQRISVMATIHDLLYLPDGVNRIEVEDYIVKLCGSIIESFAAQGRIVIKYDLESVRVDMNRIMPLALLVNEVVTNSLKHGFSNGAAGRMTVRLARSGSDIVLTIADDGVGMPAGLPRATGLGIRLVRNLARQLEGSAEFVSDHGTRVTVRFPAESKSRF